MCNTTDFPLQLCLVVQLGANKSYCAPNKPKISEQRLNSVTDLSRSESSPKLVPSEKWNKTRKKSWQTWSRKMNRRLRIGNKFESLRLRLRQIFVARFCKVCLIRTLLNFGFPKFNSSTGHFFQTLGQPRASSAFLGFSRECREEGILV